MTIHDRILYLGETPGDYRHYDGGGVECRFDSSEPTLELPADFDSTRFDIIVLHPDHPLTREEALARLRELLAVRPVVEGDAQELHGPGGLVLSLRAREVRIGDLAVALTLREFELLRLLLEHQDEVLTADEIARSIWGYETFGARNFVESHISRMRSKLARAGAHDVVATVRGVGYIVRSHATVPTGR
jgi:DNA-binding winged helix-turn-helix (wHTH) protein